MMIPFINLISHPTPRNIPLTSGPVKCFARDDDDHDDNDDDDDDHDHDMPMTLSPAIREDAGDKK